MQFRHLAKEMDQINSSQETSQGESNGKNGVVNELLLLAIEEKIKGTLKKEMARYICDQSEDQMGMNTK